MRIGKIAAPIALAAVLLAATWTAAADEQTTEQGFRVESARVDLGEVVAGTENTGTFTFHNDSAADVRILRAKPS